MRPGLGWTGLQNLQKFVRDGGLFIAVDDTTDLAVNYGFTAGVAVVRSQRLRAVGDILRMKTVDATSPIAYGYGDSLAMQFGDYRAAEKDLPLMQAYVCGLDRPIRIEAVQKGDLVGSPRCPEKRD